MKRIAPLLLLGCCIPAVFAGYSDGFITAGEYEYGVTWRSYQIPLIVDGGGALDISVRDNGRLIVQSTSTPLIMGVSGVYDILLGNNAQLLYLGGVTEYIQIGQNTTATLKGGSINYIKTMRYPSNDENVFIHARDGWSWINGDRMKGIEGHWWDSGSYFKIEFINDLDYGPVWQNIKVIPEPATMILLCLGTLLVRRKKV